MAWNWLHPQMSASRTAAASNLTAIAHGARLDDITAVAELPDGDFAKLALRDRAFTRHLVRTTLRRLGQIDAILAKFLERPLPPRRAQELALLRIGVAQLLFMGTPPHAAVNATVGAANTKPFKKLLNAVLRRVATEGAAIAAAQDAPRINTPDWLWEQWELNYGSQTARAIAAAHLEPPPLDLTAKDDPSGWAERLGAALLPTGSLRLSDAGRVADLSGYGTGAWWVQDAAAALPARLLLNALPRPAADCQVADLCAAPGGKTAQLAASGANVFAVDRNVSRLARLKENLDRLRLTANLFAGDAVTWTPPPDLDAILLDVPCTATGTIRRHPDLPWRKGRESADALLPEQDRLLKAAAAHLGPGGILVYAACSLDPREGEAPVTQLLDSRPDLQRMPAKATEIGGLADAVTASGDVRTLPSHLESLGGMDGFYIARLRREP